MPGLPIDHSIAWSDHLRVDVEWWMSALGAWQALAARDREDGYCDSLGLERSELEPEKAALVSMLCDNEYTYKQLMYPERRLCQAHFWLAELVGDVLVLPGEYVVAILDAFHASSHRSGGLSSMRYSCQVA